MIATTATGDAPAAKSILLIEDDDRLAANLQTLLEREGHRVVRLVNGLELAEALDRVRPDVVLLDLMLSWVDGYDLCRAIKRSERHARVPVFIISARVSPADLSRGREVGCDAYFRKPLDLPELFAGIRALHAAH